MAAVVIQAAEVGWVEEAVAVSAVDLAEAADMEGVVVSEVEADLEVAVEDTNQEVEDITLEEAVEVIMEVDTMVVEEDTLVVDTTEVEDTLVVVGAATVDAVGEVILVEVGAPTVNQVLRRPLQRVLMVNKLRNSQSNT